jgi:hypothetical protein
VSLRTSTQDRDFLAGGSVRCLFFRLTPWLGVGRGGGGILLATGGRCGLAAAAARGKATPRNEAEWVMQFFRAVARPWWGRRGVLREATLPSA